MVGFVVTVRSVEWPVGVLLLSMRGVFTFIGMGRVGVC